MFLHFPGSSIDFRKTKVLVRIITLRHNFPQPKILRYRNIITFFVKYMKKKHTLNYNLLSSTHVLTGLMKMIKE
jgi:hypothetical protein